MTDKKVSYALARISSCKESGYPLEGLIKSYHLNVALIKYILANIAPTPASDAKKIKVLVNEFIKACDVHPGLKSIINKRSTKSLKPWLAKMDLFFKSLKLGPPKNIAALQDETEKIFGILKISANKLFVK